MSQAPMRINWDEKRRLNRDITPSSADDDIKVRNKVLSLID
jgi:hypothetical protein